MLLSIGRFTVTVTEGLGSYSGHLITLHRAIPLNLSAVTSVSWGLKLRQSHGALRSPHHS
jgi:hypothetical protein